VRRNVGANFIICGFFAATFIASPKVFIGESITASIISSIMESPMLQKLFQPATSPGAMSLMTSVHAPMSVG
jgi:hypothetical protein